MHSLAPWLPLCDSTGWSLNATRFATANTHRRAYTHGCVIYLYISIVSNAFVFFSPICDIIVLIAIVINNIDRQTLRQIYIHTSCFEQKQLKLFVICSPCTCGRTHTYIFSDIFIKFLFSNFFIYAFFQSTNVFLYF